MLSWGGVGGVLITLVVDWLIANTQDVFRVTLKKMLSMGVVNNVGC